MLEPFCVAGALTIGLYRGMPLHMWTSHVHNRQIFMKKRAPSEMACFSLMLVGCCLSTSTWLHPINNCGNSSGWKRSYLEFRMNLQLLTIVYSNHTQARRTLELFSWNLSAVSIILRRGE
ncbi:uncharacterized protein LOC131258225 isoform X2 [Magnolia sinica]|uniref:uncharacterized protein LOC131258225 isoform X2 n=1 Tax=Magnolia sinica TaxID=86752 RepID=UPI00265B60D6|nr:uncharacterized protein LOC131258225 isoform X2 [Magnolia sinica]